MDDLFITKKLKYNTLKKAIKNDESLINFGTIDSIHMKFMNEFEKQSNSTSKLELKIEKIKKELNMINLKDPCNYTSGDISRKAHLLELIEDNQYIIKKINENHDELDYFNESLPILKKYYAIGRNQHIQNIKHIQNNNLLEFFNTHKINKEKSILNENETIIEEYLKCTLNKNIRKKNTQYYICPDCNIEKILQATDGHMVCMECGHSDQVIVEIEKVNFKDPYYENKSAGYKRINHFSELLNQFQAKESTEIQPKIFNMIITEIKKQKIIDPNKLVKKKMRSILKKLELNSYSEHIPFIINRLTGLPPPTVSRDMEEKLKKMFKEIQEPFELYKPTKRKNFVNYNYIFYKFFELLDMDHFLPHFALLKSPDKLKEQEDVWEKICKHLKWQFIPCQ